MELHQLRYAAEVDRRGSFTAAAEALHVSQSGVSAQVAKLERELGVRLFERRPRSAVLTTDGETLLPLVAAALDSVSRIRAAADSLTGLTSGHVRIGTVIGCTLPGYLSAFAEFRAVRPGISVTASEGNSSDLVAELAAGDLDVALVAHADPLPPEFIVTALVDEPVAAGVAPEHPWAGLRSVPVTALTEEDVLTLPAGTGVRTALQRSCRTAGIELAPAVQAHSPEAAVALAARGAGVAVLSASMIEAPLVRVALEGAAHASLSLACRAEPSAAARAFTRLLRERLGGEPAGEA